MSKEIAERIRAARKAVGMSQEELAHRTGYSHKSSIAHIELGHAELPAKKIKAFAKALNVSPAYLSTGFVAPDDPQPTKTDWFDALQTVALKLTKSRRIQLYEFAQFLLACQLKDKGIYEIHPVSDDDIDPFEVSYMRLADSGSAGMSKDLPESP